MDWYSYVKAFHLISVISWMAGMFYLPRLFVYHASATPGSELSETLKVMEYRLLRFIINPAMIASWVFGLTLIFAFGIIDFSTDIWLHVKLTLVIALSAFHGMLSKWRKQFAADQNTRSPKFYRIANEEPTILMIVIVILVIVKPF